MLTHAKWLKWESVEAAITSVFKALNWEAASLKAMISVGQTNVLKKCLNQKSK